MKFTDAVARWDARYRDADGLLFGEEPNEWLRYGAQWLSPGARIECVADGEGRNSTWLAGQGHDVSAFDASGVAIDKLNALAARRHVQVGARVASLEDWIDLSDSAGAAASLDAVVAIFIQFADPALRERLFKAIASVLRPGGLLIIEGYGPRQIVYRTGGPGVLENLYTPTMLPLAFPGWSVLASRDTDKEINEGSGHAGRSHLISAVLRKPGTV